MKRIWMVLAAVGGMGGAAAGDVLVLRDGRKVVGRIVDKADAYEAIVQGQTLVYSKEEVARWIRSPKEIVGDSDRLVEEAKALYQQALATGDSAESEKIFREALPKVVKAREAYAEARDLFPEGYPELDAQLLNIMRLMRLVRERIGSTLASTPAPPPPKTPAPPPPAPVTPPPPPPKPVAAPAKTGLPEAFSILIDPARRGEEGPRRTAADLFRTAREERGPMSDLAAAAHLFLSKDDKDWQLVQDVVFVKGPGFEQTYRGRLVKKTENLSVLEMSGRRSLRLRQTPGGMQVLPPGGAEFRAEDYRFEGDRKSEAYRALQDFLQALGPERLESLPEKETLQALRELARRIKEIRSGVAEPPLEALLLFFGGTSSTLIRRSGGRTDPALEPAFQDVGFVKSEFSEIWGGKSDLALEDFQKWTASGEYGLALVQFSKDYANLPEFAVRYAHGLLKLLKAVTDNRFFGRAASHFDLMAREAPPGEVREHLEALARSIREASPCDVCGGTHQVNCTACKGRKKLTLECGTCGGSGKVQTLRGVADCRACKGKGRWVNVDCPKCKATGKTECKARYCEKPVPPPKPESFFEAVPCAACAGRGLLFHHVAFSCRECLGIGRFLRPRADLRKTLR